MNNNQLSILLTNPYEVELMLETLKTGKASGPDTINNYILKNCAHELSPPLAELFNAFLSSATVPILWKEANVTPVYNQSAKGTEMPDFLRNSRTS